MSSRMDKGYQPYRIDIVLDNVCNLSCTGCIKTKYVKDRNIDYLNCVKTIIGDRKLNKYQIHFTGGEPLLKWTLLTQTIRDLRTLYKDNLVFSIHTNSTILNIDIIDFIKSNEILIHTTLDGQEKENDKIRGIGTYKIITNNINELNNRAIEISSITTTLKDGNINSISEDFINELDILNIKTWRLNIDYHGITINPNKLINKVINLYSYAVNKGISVEGTWLYPFNNLISDNKNGFCPATKGETITILPDGKISMCPYSEAYLGRLQNSWNNIVKEFDIVKQYLSKSQSCSDCIIEEYCQTQCLITREQDDNESFNWFCEIYQGLTVKLLKYHLHK